MARAATSPRIPVALALQGGGSWGAYTWGVLDVLLASRRIAIAQLTGASAGAINAAIVAAALARNSPAEARRRLRAFWLAIARTDVASGGPSMWSAVERQWSEAERQWRETVGVWLVASSTLPPNAVNPVGMSPLRDAIVANVDFEAIRAASAPSLYVSVTNVRSGLPRIIANDAITIDALLASACLPQLFQAIEIDGEPYWDGGYSGNPALRPLLGAGKARDLIVVQLTRDHVADVPIDGAAIRKRVGEIVFHSTLAAEIRAIHAMRTLAAEGEAGAAVLDLRVHRIGPPEDALFAAGSALERSRSWIERLYDAGRRSAKRFLARHGRDLGVRETLDIDKAFVDGAGIG